MKEARKLGIPVVAVVDTNCDPTVVDYVIPGNDDALRAIRLFTSKISDSVVEGVQMAGDKRAADAGVTADEQLEAAPVEIAGLEAAPTSHPAMPKWSIWMLCSGEASARLPGNRRYRRAGSRRAYAVSGFILAI